jgi:hypothetical protein
MPKIRDKPKGVVHAVGEGPVVSDPPAAPVPKRGGSVPPTLVPLTIWLRPWVYDCLAWEARQIGTPLEIFVAMHFEKCCK